MKYVFGKCGRFISIIAVPIIGFILFALCATVEDINGHFDTGLLTSILNKPLLLICGIAAILGGFYLRDSIRAITINVIFAILVHSVFPNGYISLLLIISGVLWCLTDRDYFHPALHELVELFVHEIKLFAYATFISICFIHGTGYYSYLERNAETINNWNIIKGILIVAGPWLVGVVIGLIQDIVYYKSIAWSPGDLSYFLQFRLAVTVHKALIILRIIALLASGVLIFINFDGKHLVSLIGFLIIIFCMVVYAFYQRKNGFAEKWVIIPAYFMDRKYSEDIVAYFIKFPSPEKVRERAGMKKQVKEAVKKKLSEM